MHTARSAFSLAYLEIAIPGRQCVREQPDEIIRRRPKAVVSNLFRSAVQNGQISTVRARNQDEGTPEVLSFCFQIGKFVIYAEWRLCHSAHSVVIMLLESARS